MWWENYALQMYVGGAALVVLGWLLLLRSAFKYHKGWGVGLLLFPPAALFFIHRHFFRAVLGLFFIFIGTGVILTPIVMNKIHPQEVDEKPIEKVVKDKPDQKGEPTLTVTGVKNYDYAQLKEKSNLEVLQMANEDVTDQTLENLRDLTSLRELDLSNTQITNEGLKYLKELPKLEVLKLNGVKITDEGVREHIFPLESLKELSVQRVPQVTKRTRDEWKAVKEGRKVAPAF